ncbi:hypothetical protein [Desulfobacula sp.]|uniref:hypothetical protein n=1 Tax=Desulfobacula sp. TaxID=2593537 RepID=UPI002637B5FC|nr:hypothetical protein [Desulfobacula sp.]
MDQKIYHHIRKESIANFFFNAVVNGIIAYFIGRSTKMLFIWGKGSFGGDIVATAFFLLIIVSLVVIPLKKRGVRKGTLPSLEWNQCLFLHRILSKFPQNTILCSLVFGFVGLAFIAPVTLLPFWVMGITQMTPQSYIIFKSIWGGCLVAVMIWPIIICALGNTTPESAS